MSLLIVGHWNDHILRFTWSVTIIVCIFLYNYLYEFNWVELAQAH